MGKTLVTGGAGFIGSHVVRALLDGGREVRVLGLPGERRDNLDGLDVEWIEADITDRSKTEQAVSGCSRVFHLAAMYALWLPRRERMYEVNCLGAMNLCWAALRQSVERVVFTSSIAAVGARDDGHTADEATAYNHQGRHNDYIVSKWLSEEHAKTFAEHGLPIVFCNPTGPIGERDIGPTPTGKTLVEFLNGRLRFYFDSWVNLVDVRDVARGHLQAEAHGRIGERYLLAGQNLSMRDFLKRLMCLSGLAGAALRIPLSAAVPVGDALDALATRATRRAPPFTGDTLRYLRAPMRVSNERAKEELKMSFQCVDDALVRSMAWFIDNGYVRDSARVRRALAHFQMHSFASQPAPQTNISKESHAAHQYDVRR